jgi:hypothetical protein
VILLHQVPEASCVAGVNALDSFFVARGYFEHLSGVRDGAEAVLITHSHVRHVDS